MRGSPPALTTMSSFQAERPPGKAMLRRAAPQRVADTLEPGRCTTGRASRDATARGHLGRPSFACWLLHGERRTCAVPPAAARWCGAAMFIDGRTTDVHVGRLRKTLMDNSSTNDRTVRGAVTLWRPPTTLHGRARRKLPEPMGRLPCSSSL